MGTMAGRKTRRSENDLVTCVGRALRRAAKAARRTARMHGTPIVVMVDGKVVEMKP